MTHRWLPVLLILLGGWGLLEALSYQTGLGDYAKSPQRLQLKQGLTAIVAGGSAGLVFMEDRFRKKAQLLIRCEEGRRTISLRRGQVSEEICGVRVELLDILPEGKVNVEVRWGPEAESTPESSAEPEAEARSSTAASSTPASSTSASPTNATPDTENSP